MLGAPYMLLLQLIPMAIGSELLINYLFGYFSQDKKMK